MLIPLMLSDAKYVLRRFSDTERETLTEALLAIISAWQATGLVTIRSNASCLIVWRSRSECARSDHRLFDLSYCAVDFR